MIRSFLPTVLEKDVKEAAAVVAPHDHSAGFMSTQRV